MMNLIPVHDNIWVERDKAAEIKTPGGIVIPGDASRTPDTAKVIAVGPGRIHNGTLIEPAVSVGDTVVISRFAGSEMNVGIEKVTLVPWGDVLAILPKILE